MSSLIIGTSRSIVATLHAHRVPIELDYLSVDIDSADLWVLRTLLGAGADLGGLHDTHGHAAVATFLREARTPDGRPADAPGVPGY